MVECAGSENFREVFGFSERWMCTADDFRINVLA